MWRFQNRVTFAVTREAIGMTAAEARPLVARGLIVEAVKPRGFGNTRAWKVTAEGAAIATRIRYTARPHGFHLVE